MVTTAKRRARAAAGPGPAAAGPGAPAVVDQLLTVRDVQRLTTLSRSTIYRKARAGELPAPIWLTDWRKAWRSSEIAAWLGEAARRADPWGAR